MFVWCWSFSNMELFFSFYIKTQLLPRCQSIHTPLFSLPQHILFFKFESFLTKITWWGLDLQASPRTNLLFFIMTEAFEFVLVQFLWRDYISYNIGLVPFRKVFLFFKFIWHRKNYESKIKHEWIVWWWT